MPCSDSSSSINLRLDLDEKFIAFDFAKITCGREITGNTGFAKYCMGKTLPEILEITYPEAAHNLNLTEDEARYVLYLEWDALRAAIAQYLGIEGKDVDHDRCKITSIDYDETGIQIAEVILPPKEMPKILPCSLGDKN